MREIKFRGITEHNGKWRHGNLLNETTIGEVGEELSHYSYATVLKDSIGQFTGLKDKNDIEIYEGDIVSWTEEINQCKECDNRNSDLIDWNNKFCTNCGIEINKRNYKKIGSVSFQHTRWNITIQEMCYDITGALINTIEIIGNIHENPELLK